MLRRKEQAKRSETENKKLGIHVSHDRVMRKATE